MNTQSERALRQQRRWANQQKPTKVISRVKIPMVKEDDEYDEKQYMEMRETIAMQTLTYMRLQQQLIDARRQIKRLEEEVEDLRLQKYWLQKDLDDLTRMT